MDGESRPTTGQKLILVFPLLFHSVLIGLAVVALESFTSVFRRWFGGNAALAANGIAIGTVGMWFYVWGTIRQRQYTHSELQAAEGQRRQIEGMREHPILQEPNVLAGSLATTLRALFLGI